MRLPFRRPRFEDLDRYLAARDYGRALSAVAEELKRNPKQFNLLLRQAEILGLAGDREAAVKLYRELAEKFARDGFYAKSIALYKKVLRLEPQLEDVHIELARLLEEEGREHLPLRERVQGVHDAQGPAIRGAQNPELKELAASVLFASFRREALEQILTSTALRSYTEEEVIVREGEPGSSLFLIVSGTVAVITRDENDLQIPLAELGPGDFFGEVSLLTGRPRTASIVALTSVLAIELDRADVDRIAGDHPEVRTVLEEFCSRRAHDTVEALVRRRRGET